MHAAGVEPVWLTLRTTVSSLHEPAQVPADMEPHDLRTIGIPSDEKDSAGGTTVIPPDLSAVEDDTPAVAVSGAIAERRLEKIARFEVESPEPLAALPPEEDRKPVETIAYDSGPERSMEPAHLLKKTFPVYPALAKTGRIQGMVLLRATITESGILEDVTVIGGHPMLVQAALDAVRQWRYAPARINGVIVRSSVDISVNFKLNFQ